MSTNTNSKKRKARIHNQAYAYYSQDERVYFNALDDTQKNLVATREDEITFLNNRIIPLRFQLLQAEVDPKVRAIAIQKFERVCSMDETSNEFHKILNWIETLCKVPFGKFKGIGLDTNSDSNVIQKFISDIKCTMDTKVFGHSDAKDQIVRLLAQWISNPKSKGLVIGIQGSMGTGKTTLVKEAICKVLGLPFALIPLGGVSDGSYLVGHSYTYEGSTWGRIIDMLIRCECMNPVVFFDELDKVSKTRHGEEIINTLIHMTDPSQNESFNDKYFTGIDFDLSRSLIIFSYNDEENINPILRDRMVKIHTDGYKMADKLIIAKRHLVPDVLAEFGYRLDDIVFDDHVLKLVVNKIDAEEGVRNLKRAIHEIVSNLNLVRLLESNNSSNSKSKNNTLKTIHVSADHVAKYVHVSKSKTNTSHLSMYA